MHEVALHLCPAVAAAAAPVVVGDPEVVVVVAVAVVVLVFAAVTVGSAALWVDLHEKIPYVLVCFIHTSESGY